MKISDIQVNQSRVDIEAEIVEVSPVKEFSKFGKVGKVATATLRDDSGEILLTLWDEQTETLKKGEKIKISNAYVKEWQGEKQINIGRYGIIEKIK
jgi:replication factor A1